MAGFKTHYPTQFSYKKTYCRKMINEKNELYRTYYLLSRLVLAAITVTQVITLLIQYY